CVVVLSAGRALGRKAAATVNGSVITRADLEQEVEWMQAVPEYQQALLEADKSDDPTTRDRLGAQLVALELNRLVVFRIIDQEVTRRSLTVEDRDRRQALTDTVAQITNVLGDEVHAVEIFNSLPRDFRISLVDRQARANALQRSLKAEKATDDQLRAFYDANRERFERVCARYVLSRTQDLAREALTHVQQGQRFEDVARDLSADPNAKETGGDVGCFLRDGVEKVFSDAAFDTRLGEVVGPVESTVGWYLIQVYDKRGDTFERARSDVEKSFAESGPAIAFQSLIQKLLGDADVVVNPRYGRWDASQRRVVAATTPTTGGRP